ncbi:MAG: RNA polymerase sigma factor, partial [Isosphaeraceae bacterium]
VAARRRRRHEERAAAWFAGTVDDGRQGTGSGTSSGSLELDPSDAEAELKSLPLDQREVIVAHLWGGLTFEQIGEVSGTSSSTAHRLYAAGLATLRERLGVACPGSRTGRKNEDRDRQEPGLTELESALKALAPAPAVVDRDRLMFEAGAASARRSVSAARRLAWPSIAAALGLIVVGQSAALVLRPGPKVVERLVVVREPAVPAAPTVARVEPEPPPADAPTLANNPLEPVWGDSSRALWPSRWATVADARLTSELALALALDPPVEPAGLPAPIASDAPDLPRPPSSVGELRRQLWQDPLRPGDPS